MTWGAGQWAVAQSGAWGPSQHPARWGGLRAEMHGWRMPESMQHELQDCPPPRSPNRQSASRVSPEMGPGGGQAQPSSIRGQSPRALTSVLTARTGAAPTLQGHAGA